MQKLTDQIEYHHREIVDVEEGDNENVFENDPEFERESRHAMATRKRARNGTTGAAETNHHPVETNYTAKQLNGGLKHTESAISEITPTNGSSTVNNGAPPVPTTTTTNSSDAPKQPTTTPLKTKNVGGP